MAEAAFLPSNTDFSGTFWNNAGAAQNFMQRRQRMQWESEDRERAQHIENVLMPVRSAQAQAQLATARATLQTLTQQEELRKRFANESATANAEYQAAVSLPSFEEQNRALALLQPKYSWMGLLPEGQGFVAALNDSRGNAFKSYLTNQKMVADVNAAKQQNEYELAQIAARNQGQLAVAKERGTGLTADQRLLENLQRARAGGDPDEIAFYESRVKRLSAPPSQASDAILQLRAKANEIRAIDPEGAKLLDQRAESLAAPRTDPMAALNAILGVGPATTPAQATTPAPATTTITSETIVKDPNFRW